MASTVQHRTVTRTSVEGADHIKRNLSNVAEEIARVRDQARGEVDALEKIRGMLDTGYLNDLLATIEQLEVRIEELEDGTGANQSTLNKLERELADEQHRLQKLWDAYKAQEDELERVKRDYPLMEEKLFERERTIEGLRREVSRLEPLAKSKAEADRLSKQNQKLESELSVVERRLQKAQDTAASLQKEVDDLRSLQKDLHRLRGLESDLEEERERLAKLYSVYEDVDAEKRGLEGTLADWEAWYESVRPALGALEHPPRG